MILSAKRQIESKSKISSTTMIRAINDTKIPIESIKEFFKGTLLFTNNEIQRINLQKRLF